MLPGRDGGASFGRPVSTAEARYHPPVPLLPAAALAFALSAAAPPAASSAAPRGAAELVDVAELIPRAVLDVRYATERNFAKRRLYPVARCLLVRPVAERLVRAAARLERHGYRLRLFDCYRPLSVQRALWAAYPRAGYVADPEAGSPHNRGAAVDVGLSAPDGAELPMPSAFDAFGRSARAFATEGIPIELRVRRDRLRVAMEAEGFVVNPLEWWHFAAREAGAYPLLDVPLEAVP
jgi:D-alanyl-D-alanine dipeptidase